jgi:hypothetical protein
MKAIGRRALLIGSLVLGVAASAGIVLTRSSQRRQQRIADARADYLAGRVQIVEGWIVSDSEAAEAGPRPGS